MADQRETFNLRPQDGAIGQWSHCDMCAFQVEVDTGNTDRGCSCPMALANGGPGMPIIFVEVGKARCPNCKERMPEEDEPETTRTFKECYGFKAKLVVVAGEDA